MISESLHGLARIGTGLAPIAALGYGVTQAGMYGARQFSHALRGPSGPSRGVKRLRYDVSRYSSYPSRFEKRRTRLSRVSSRNPSRRMVLRRRTSRRRYGRRRRSRFARRTSLPRSAGQTRVHRMTRMCYNAVSMNPTTIGAASWAYMDSFPGSVVGGGASKAVVVPHAQQASMQIAFSLDQLPNVTEFLSLFISYRIAAVEVRISTAVDIGSISGTPQFYPDIFLCYEPNMLSGGAYQPPGLDTIRENGSTELISIDEGRRTIVRTYRPRLHRVVCDGAQPGQTILQGGLVSPWIRTSNYKIPHPGLIIGVDNSANDVSDCRLIFEFKYFLEFRGYM